jgi:hypothetical protein
MLLSESSFRNQILDYFEKFFSLLVEKKSYKLKENNRRPKIYTYTKSSDSYSLVLEAINGSSLKYYMTAYGAGIRAGDFIVISDPEFSVTFNVENIDYYLDPPDLWIACLIQSELP